MAETGTLIDFGDSNPVQSLSTQSSDDFSKAATLSKYSNLICNDGDYDDDGDYDGDGGGDDVDDDDVFVLCPKTGLSVILPHRVAWH